jgi:hypothetical protein
VIVTTVDTGAGVALTEGAGVGVSGANGISDGITVAVELIGCPSTISVAEGVTSAAGSAVLVTVTDVLTEAVVRSGTGVGVVKTVGETIGRAVAVDSTSPMLISTELPHAVMNADNTVERTTINTDLRNDI